MTDEVQPQSGGSKPPPYGKFREWKVIFVCTFLPKYAREIDKRRGMWYHFLVYENIPKRSLL